MEEKVFNKKQIITIVLGVLLTAVSFCFYFLLNKPQDNYNQKYILQNLKNFLFC